MINYELIDAVTKNNLTNVSKCIKNGQTIFDNNYDDYGYKTVIYNGLINNYKIYQHIYILLNGLKNKINNNNKYLLNIINKILRRIKRLKCSFLDINNYSYKLSESFINFTKVYEILNKYLEPLMSIIEKMTDQKRTNINIFELYEINKCHIHSDHNNVNDYNIIDLININKEYLDNIEIMKILLNQQAFELATFYSKNNNIESIINIYKESKFTNINYMNNNKTLLTSIIYCDKSEAKKLLLFDSLIKNTNVNLNILDDDKIPLIVHAIKNDLYDVTKIIYDNIEKKDSINYYPLVDLYLKNNIQENICDSDSSNDGIKYKKYMANNDSITNEYDEELNENDFTEIKSEEYNYDSHDSNVIKLLLFFLKLAIDILYEYLKKVNSNNIYDSVMEYI